MDNDLSNRIMNIIHTIRLQRSNFMQLHFIREGEAREAKFFASLIDDRTKTLPSYFEFLQSIHSKIMAKIQRR
jgi:hypothetical protein